MASKSDKDYENEHLRDIQKAQQEVTDAYRKTITKIFSGSSALTYKNGVFQVSDYKAFSDSMDQILLEFNNSVDLIMVNGIKGAWEMAIDKNIAIINNAYANNNIIDAVEAIIYNPQAAALEQFTNQITNGLTLSDRVWNQTNQLRSEIEKNLFVGIENGDSAAEMARNQVQYLQNPDMLFRRVRDAEGTLRLSKAAQEYHPGQGVYRSSHKNAMRLTRDTVNDSYRQSDMVRYQSTPFILGYEVNTSGNHPRTDICFTNPYYKIITSKGEVCIKDIKVGDLVLSHKGKFRKVLKVFRTSDIEIEMTKISGKIMYDHRGKEYSITATNNHPFLIGDEWKHISDIKVGEKVRILATACKKCGILIPHHRSFCSKSCASFNTATNQHKDPLHTEKLSAKRKKLISDNGGKMPWLAEYIGSGKHKLNLIATPEKNEQARIRSEELLSKGLHPFQRKDNLIKANKTLGSLKYNTFIEKKIGWLLNQKGISYTKNYPFKRDILFVNGNNRLYFIDFVLNDHRIAIEVDGEYWHKDKEADLVRQQEIESKGFMVLRFPGDQIRNRLYECSDEIDRVLKNHNGEYQFTDFTIEKAESIIQRRGGNKIVKYNFEVETDNSYICNGFVVHNCDELKGEYPKTFVWRKWHNQCLCFCTSKLASSDEFDKYQAAVMDGTDDKFEFTGTVNDLPEGFNSYVEDQQGSMDKWKRKPDWVTDNNIKI